MVRGNVEVRQGRLHVEAEGTRTAKQVSLCSEKRYMKPSERINQSPYNWNSRGK